MANFAKVENAIVTQVIAVVNDELLDAEGNESEEIGKAFIESIGLVGEWVQTSYNGNPIQGKDRGPYAGINYKWDGTTFAAPPVPEPIEETA